MSKDQQSRTEQRAKEIWEREGRPNGRAKAHWRQAEEELAREDAIKEPDAGPSGPAPLTSVEPAGAENVNAPKATAAAQTAAEKPRAKPAAQPAEEKKPSDDRKVAGDKRPPDNKKVNKTKVESDTKKAPAKKKG